MYKRLILHDLPEGQFASAGLSVTPSDTVFPAEPIVGSCTGCYGCWIKTPGLCVIEDRGKGFAALLSGHDEFIAISRLTFGGFSSPVKALLDRSIGYMLPFFKITGSETHHPKRSDKKLVLRYIFYGKDMRASDKEIAKKLAAANALNMAANNYTVDFFQYDWTAL